MNGCGETKDKLLLILFSIFEDEKVSVLLILYEIDLIEEENML
jgi:hypothetical protein